MITRKAKNANFSIYHLYMKRPTFMDGLASNFDLYNAKPVNPHSSSSYDMLGMKSDFNLVGQDFYNAINKLRKELSL